MISTEDGLTFAKDGTAWRCLQVPGLWMLPGSAYAVRGATGEFHILGDTSSSCAAERDKRTSTSSCMAGALLRSDERARLAIGMSIRDRHDQRPGLGAHLVAERPQLPHPCSGVAGPAEPESALSANA